MLYNPEMIRSRQHTSIDSVARDALSQVKTQEAGLREYALLPVDELSYHHHTMGRWIRNEYGFWHDSPLTETWRANVAGRDVREGIDYSEDHPDAVSMRVLRRMQELLRERFGYTDERQSIRQVMSGVVGGNQSST